ncbi:WD40 repeat-like protein [Microstroma glucosiphilum]|uniref:WD40 repeat-like protein n=1 Tax=Pseudomicrostroma glucosiphilum TaxID=1684307 RepID=A0A316UFL2_9BASI|nr:WD40 repeat-like protein [Pseudomicrostroma glucosiphilum]PWN24107.1 WD40 repeat-like protein [Pseudomicrostroma glucosiphilum]
MAAPNIPPGSFAAPEGVYTAAAITLPLAELPISGNIPLAMVPASMPTASSSHDSAASSGGAGGAATNAGPGRAGATAMLGTPSSSGAAAVSPSNSASGLGPSGSTAIAANAANVTSLPPYNTLAPSLLPPSWRKELGCIVQPSLSSASIRWGPPGSSSSDFTGALIAGVGVVGGRKNKDPGTDASGTGSNTPASGGRRLRKASNAATGINNANEISTASAYRGPNPPIEGVMVSQGIDAPASSTMGGSGGMIGMSALTSYGFLPSNNGRDPFDLTSALDLRGEASGGMISPTSTFKAAKNASKPKNNVKQSNSSFIIRTWVHPDLKDILSSLEKAYNARHGNQDDGDEDEAQGSRVYHHQPPFYITQRGRTLLWFLPHLPSPAGGAAPSTNVNDQSQQPTVLLRILFSSPPSSHDLNQLTRSPTTLDLVVGFPTGDLIWIDLMALKYSRFNKGGCCTDSGVTKVRWLPSISQFATGASGSGGGGASGAGGAGAGGGGEGLFVSAHVDGCMLIWDREREDAEAGKGWAPRLWRLKGNTPGRRSSTASVVDWDPRRNIIVSRPGLVHQPGSHESEALINGASSAGLNYAGEGYSSYDSGATQTAAGLLSPKREETHLPGEEEQVAPAGGAKHTTQQAPKWDKNPVTHWRVSRSKINDFAISPDLGCIAVVSEDSLLRIIDLSSEALVASHSSYFGSFLSLSFSTDGRYLLTTSCDDLVSLYQPRPTTAHGVSQPTPSRLLARCVGHSSWVRGVAFDPYRWREGDRTYRFGSVGEDGKVCLWDFAGGRSLGRIKATGGGAGADGKRPSSIHLGSYSQKQQRPGNSNSIGNEAPTSSAAGADGEETHDPFDIYHPAPSRSAIPTLQPIATHQLSASLLSTTTNIMVTTSTSPLAAIRFSPKGFIVLHDNGVTTSWERPRGKRPLVLQQTEEELQQAAAKRDAGAGKASGKGAAGLLSKGWGSMRGGLTRTLSTGPAPPQSPQMGGAGALQSYSMQNTASAGLG